MLIGLMFLAPNAYASENESTITSMSENPYDLVNSKGEIIKYSEVQELIKEKGPAKLNPKGSPGSGAVLSEVAIPNFSNKPFKEMGTGAILDENKLSIKTNNLVNPFAIFGADGRSLVKDTSKDPYKKITYLQIEFPTAIGICTGTVIGKDMVLTNAHCVRDILDDEHAIDAVALPALKDNHYSYGAYWLEDYFYPVGYDNSGGSAQYDFAVLKFHRAGDKVIGDAVGYLPIKQVNSVKGNTIKVYGYPGDKAAETGVYNQWGMSGSVTEDDTYYIKYMLDTNQGQSGSAILNSSNEIIGVHSGAFLDRVTREPVINGGPKMGKPMVDFITWDFWQ